MNLQQTLSCTALSVSLAGLSLLTAAPAQAFMPEGDGFGGAGWWSADSQELKLGFWGVEGGGLLENGSLTENKLTIQLDNPSVDKFLTGTGSDGQEWSVSLYNLSSEFGEINNSPSFTLWGDMLYESNNQQVRGNVAFTGQSNGDFRSFSVTGNLASVPEPTGVLGAGIAVAMMAGLRKRAKQDS